uniref:Fibronectin type-III domain-containing protein n=1 Tax=Heterosigma akashiwo TaxID=2829 RepID=A0A7S3UR83_HETAK
MLEKKRLPSAPPIEQCPVLALPISVHQRQEVDGVELCSKPCVPPFPYTPEVVEVKETMIALEWANPEYDGPENLKYEVQGRGKTRVNKNWKTLCTYATISQPFFKIPNLVPGVELMFRVRAFNYGGWGEYSWETDYIIPNPVARSISLARDLRAAAGFGARRVLAVMAARAHLAEVQRQGAKQLLAMAARYGGFKRISVAKECVEVVLKAMKKFDKDKVMQSLGCLVVGWSCKTGEEVINTALQNDAEKVLVDAQNTFKGDTAIINHSKWLYSVLQNTDNLSLSTGDESWMGAIGYY